MAAVVPTSPIQHPANPPHTTSPKLQDHAALAALYVTNQDNRSKDGYAILDSQHKLSSAGAAASLKYANPQDLPSYPSSGLSKNNTAAGEAASFGWANQKPFEPWTPDPSAPAAAAAMMAKDYKMAPPWKPDPSAPAAAAAMMAKDYKMAPPWQPEQSANGARAAVLAQKEGGKVDVWRPEADSPWVSSAAAQAFKKYGAGSVSPVLGYAYTGLGRQGSLMAASGAMLESRRRAISTPDPIQKPQAYPDEANAVANALSAATSASAHGSQKWSGDYADGGSVPYTNMPREMYTSNPPVVPDINERNRSDVLHASAVAMAKRMYVQQKESSLVSQAQSGAVAAHGRKSSSSTNSDEVLPMRFNNLQEAAQKLAQERLARLHDEHAQNQEYRDYYGGPAKPSNRLSMRGRVRRRASSDGDLDQDQEQSEQIRAQMSLFSSNLSQVDEKKRQQDREKLIAAAQRNVTKSLHGMDERVFAGTGKVTPSLLSEWEVKAHAAAQAKSNTRMETHMENNGKVHIGGGKFMDQSEIDAVASRNVQPVLDEINEKAAAERERQAALKADQEEQARKAESQKARDKESKAIDKKLKQQEKDEEKLRKQEEKQEKRASKRKSGNAGIIAPVAAAIMTGAEATAIAVTGATATATATATAAAATATEEPSTLGQEAPVAQAPTRTSTEDQGSVRRGESADAANNDEATALSTSVSPSTPRSKRVKGWLKTTFSRRMSKGQRVEKDGDGEGLGKGEKAFVGGAALTGASANNSSVSLAAGSQREVALASPSAPTAKETEPEAIQPETTQPGATESEATQPETTQPGATESEATQPDATQPSMETDPALEDDEEGEGRAGRSARRESDVSAVSVEDEGRDEEPAAPRMDSHDDDDEDEFQEARDNFDEDLAPPPTFPAEKSRSPAREAKFKEDID